jgi:hypothetical protein
MKNVIISIISIVMFFWIINQVNAWSLEKKLYKQVIITKVQIKKDYWDIVNLKIRDLFIQYRYLKNYKTINKLETLLKKEIIKLNTKRILYKSDKKKLNLYNNVYYRIRLLLDYQLKK